MEQCGEEIVPQKGEPPKDQIPEEIPVVKNKHIEDLKKRRSSISHRRSTSGFSSTFRVACSVVDASLPPSEKTRRITELCLNHTLMDLKSNALEKDQEVVAAFSENLKDKMEEILKKIQNSGDEVPSLKKETQTRTYIRQMKEEKTQWNEEFSRRRQAYQEAKNKLKDVLKGKTHIEATRLKSEDVKFLKTLPDFVSVNKKIVSYQNRHCLGLIELEKNARRVYHSLAIIDRQLDDVQRAMVPTFQWT